MWPDLKEELELELAQLGKHLTHTSSLRNKLRETPPNDVEIMALATFLHSFYNGVEIASKRVPR